MKKSKYQVLYDNGKMEIYWETSLTIVYCRARVNTQGWQIQNIEDEFGNIYTELKVDYKIKIPQS